MQKTYIYPKNIIADLSRAVDRKTLKAMEQKEKFQPELETVFEHLSKTLLVHNVRDRILFKSFLGAWLCARKYRWRL